MECDLVGRCRTPMPEPRTRMMHYAGLWSTLRSAEGCFMSRGSTSLSPRPRQHTSGVGMVHAGNKYSMARGGLHGRTRKQSHRLYTTLQITEWASPSLRTPR